MAGMNMFSSYMPEFPTIKRLAMLSIARRLNDLNISPNFVFQNDHENCLSDENIAKLTKIVADFELPRRLSREFYFFLVEIYSEVGKWLRTNYYHMTKVGINSVNLNNFSFDVHGKLNCYLTLKYFFDERLTQVQEKSEMMELLKVAVFFSCPVEVDIILQRIFLLEGFDLQTFPEPDFEVETRIYRMVFSFEYPPSQAFLKSLSFTLEDEGRLLINDNGIVIVLNNRPDIQAPMAPRVKWS